MNCLPRRGGTQGYFARASGEKGEAGELRRSRRAHPPRVLHVPQNIGGNASGLSDALRGLGWDSTVWTLLEDPYGFPGDKVWWRSSTPQAVREFRRLRAIFEAAFRFDIIHYNFGTTMAQPPPLQRHEEGRVKRTLATILARYRSGLQHFELWLMKTLGCKIFVHYQGDDARQEQYQLGYSISLLQAKPDTYTAGRDRQRRRQIALLARYAERSYAVNPDLLNALPSTARFIPYSHLDTRAVEVAVPQAGSSRSVVIGHAPTDRAVKGTSYVIDAVKELENQGHPVELRLVEGLGHDQAMAAYASMDILVDQLFAGWYGGLAVELMAMGKPVLAYIRDEDLVWVPPGMAIDIPVINVTTRTLQSALLDLVTTQRDSIVPLGLSSRKFVETWHDPQKIAEEIAADYEAALASDG